MKTTSIFVSLVFAAALLAAPVRAQVEVEPDGAVKIGELAKATKVNGSSLEIAVKKIFVYPTANRSASFSIYNNSISGPTGIGGKSLTWNAMNQPTYRVPETAGGLILGTSAKPLGNVYAGYLFSNGQSTTSDQRVKENVRELASDPVCISPDGEAGQDRDLRYAGDAGQALYPA